MMKTPASRFLALTISPWVVCIMLPTVLAFPSGCDDTETPAARSVRLHAEDLSRQLDEEQRSHRRDLNHTTTEIVQLREDFLAVHTVLVGGAITIVLLILLLARERRCRRVVERLLRLLLDRIHGTRIPP